MNEELLNKFSIGSFTMIFGEGNMIYTLGYLYQFLGRQMYSY
jgi:hypothetical protein